MRLVSFPNLNEEPPKLTAGDIVKYLRSKRKMTQEELANKICKHKSIISKIERGERLVDGELASSLSKSLDCKADMLINPSSYNILTF